MIRTCEWEEFDKDSTAHSVDYILYENNDRSIYGTIESENNDRSIYRTIK